MAGLFSKENRKNVDWKKAAMGGGALSVYADLKAGDPMETKTRTTMGFYNPQAGNVSRQGIGVNTEEFQQEKDKTGLQKYSDFRSAMWKVAVPMAFDAALPGTGPLAKQAISSADSSEIGEPVNKVDNNSATLDNNKLDIGNVASMTANIIGKEPEIDNVDMVSGLPATTSGLPETLEPRNDYMNLYNNQSPPSFTPSNKKNSLSKSMFTTEFTPPPLLDDENTKSGISQPGGLYNPYAYNRGQQNKNNFY